MSSEVNPEIIAKTQKTLGKYVKKPVLSEKLLKKPPFRFLHDVIKAVIKDTGFLHGLFTEEELNSENVKEKEAKIAFLTKLIEAIKTLSKTDLKVRPSKIVAGLEPKETNVLLQTMAKCIEKKIDSKDYVKKLNRKPIKKPLNSVETPKNSDRSSRSKEKGKNKEKIKSKIEDSLKIDESKITEKLKDPEHRLENHEETVEISVKNHETAEKVVENLEVTDNNNEETSISVEQKDNEKNEPRQISARPKSARPKTGDRLMKKSENFEPRPSSSLLRPPSVRPSSARPGAPRLRPDTATILPINESIANIKVIVENFDSVFDEDGTVTIEHAPEEPSTNLEIKEDNQGQLVEQILQEFKEKTVEIDYYWEQQHDVSVKEVTQLRGLIQNLTKTAQPLGKLMNYFDVDAMHNELQMWTNTKRQLYGEIEKQKKLSAESVRPLLDKMERYKAEILKVEDEIAKARSNILKNERRILELLTK